MFYQTTSRTAVARPMSVATLAALQINTTVIKRDNRFIAFGPLKSAQFQPVATNTPHALRLDVKNN